MSDTLLTTISILGIVIIAIALLAWRDAVVHRRFERQTPIPIRIGYIRDDAELMSGQFQGMLEREQGTAPYWAGTVLGYYRRLEALASEERPSPELAVSLAEEVELYIRENRLKGVSVHLAARQLAALARQLPAG
jgi:hypothetical protein